MAKISVIMSTYNDGPELWSSIQSILLQTFSDFEFLICDDASSSKTTLDILHKFEAEDPRVKVIYNVTNEGFSKCLNKCIFLSSGEFLARMDSDDVSLPTRLEKEVEFLERHKDVSVVGTDVVLFDENGPWGKQVGQSFIRGDDAFFKGTVCHPSVLIRKSDLISVGCYTVFSKKTRTAEDFDLWNKFCFHGYEIANIHESLFLYFDSFLSSKKRTFKSQFFNLKNKNYWRRKYSLSLLSFLPSAIRSLFVTLLPRMWYIRLHRRKYHFIFGEDDLGFYRRFLKSMCRIIN